MQASLADLLGGGVIATGVPVEENDYLYENPRALSRVMLLADWRSCSVLSHLPCGVGLGHLTLRHTRSCPPAGSSPVARCNAGV